MKRLCVTLARIAFGLFFTWLCVYIASKFSWHILPHFSWLEVHQSDEGNCFDLDHCSDAPWWLYVAAMVFIAGPTTLITWMNLRAIKCWPFIKWLKLFGFTISGITFVYASFIIVK